MLKKNIFYVKTSKNHCNNCKVGAVFNAIRITDGVKVVNIELPGIT